VNPGYQVRNILTTELTLPTFRYANPADTVRFFDQLIARIQEIPVLRRRADRTSSLSPARATWSACGPRASRSTASSADHDRKSRGAAGYFSAMRVPLVAGRFFNAADRADSPKVLLVNESSPGSCIPMETPSDIASA